MVEKLGAKRHVTPDGERSITSDVLVSDEFVQFGR